MNEMLVNEMLVNEMPVNKMLVNNTELTYEYDISWQCDSWLNGSGQNVTR